MATTEPTVADRWNNLTGLLDRNRDTFKKLLPGSTDPDRLISIVQCVVRQNPDILFCTPQSVAMCALQSAKLDLEPDQQLGHCFFIPRNLTINGAKVKTCTFQLGYKGLAQLAWRSRQVKSIDADVVYSADEFSYQKGTDARLRHVRSLDKDRGDRIAFWAMVQLTTGGVRFVVMSKSEIDKVRDNYAASVSTYSPWATHYDEMGLKTVFIRATNLLPTSVRDKGAVQLQTAIAAENVDVPIATELIESGPRTPEASTRLDALNSELKNDTKERTADTANKTEFTTTTTDGDATLEQKDIRRVWGYVDRALGDHKRDVVEGEKLRERVVREQLTAWKLNSTKEVPVSRLSEFIEALNIRAHTIISDLESNITESQIILIRDEVMNTAKGDMEAADRVIKTLCDGLGIKALEDMKAKDLEKSLRAVSTPREENTDGARNQ